MKKMAPSQKKKILTAMFFVMILTSVVSFFILKQDVQQEKRTFRGVSVEIESVRTGSIARRVSVAGVLVANQQVIVKPQVSGVIAEILVHGGTEVAMNDPIMRIDDRLYRAQLKESEAKKMAAKSEYDRVSSLVSKKFGSQKKLDEAMAGFKVADAQLDGARKRMNDTVIRAPFDGAVSIHTISLGAPISEQTELFTLTDLDPILLDFKVPADYIRGLSVGQKIIVDVDGFAAEKFAATIAAIDSKVDTAAHSILVRAMLNNKKRILKPGLFARVELIVGSVDDALLVPRSAIETSGENSYVYKVVNGVANRIPVQIGFEEKNVAQIAYGVSDGDKIITVGTNKVKDGYPVVYDDENVDAPADPAVTPDQESGTVDQQSVVEPAPDLSDLTVPVRAK